MKKYLSILLALIMTVSLFSVSISVSAEETVTPAATEGYETVTLTGDDLVLGDASFCRFEGHNIINDTNTNTPFSQFSVVLPEDEYITDFSITITNTDSGGWIQVRRIYCGIYLEDNTQLIGSNAINENGDHVIKQTDGASQVSMTVSDANLDQKISKLHFFVNAYYWNDPGILSYTVDSITYTRKVHETITVTPTANEFYETVTLTGAGLVFGNIGWCSKGENNSFYTDSISWPFARFSVALPEDEYITDFSITFENTSERTIGIDRGNSGVYLAGGTQVLGNNGSLTATNSSYVNSGETATYSMNIADGYLKQKLGKLYFSVCTYYWNAPGVLSFTVESVTYTRRVHETETVTLEDDDLVFGNIGYCTAGDNNSFYTDSKTWPFARFSVTLPENEYITDFSITIEGTSERTIGIDRAESGIYLADGTQVLGKNGSLASTAISYFSGNATATNSMSIADDYLGKKISKLYFSVCTYGWSTPGILSFNVVSVTYTKRNMTGIMENITVPDNEIVLENQNVYSVDGNTAISTGGSSPQFRIVNTIPVYTDRVEFTVSSTSDKDLTSLGVTLRFDDGTDKSLGNKGAVKANLYKQYAIQIPDDCIGKKLSKIILAGWFQNAPTEGYVLTVTDYKLHDVPSTSLSNVIGGFDSPFTYQDAEAAYDDFFDNEKLAVEKYATFVDYAPGLTSVSVVDDIASVYDGCLWGTASIGVFSDVEDLVSEVGFLAIPTQTLGGSELTLETANAQKVFVAFEDGDDNSGYSTYQAPIRNNPGDSAVGITVRAYVVYAEDENEAIYYSDALTGTLPTIIPIGDANGDDIIDIVDLVLLELYTDDSSVSIHFLGADCNADNSVDASDFTLLTGYLLEISVLADLPYANGFTLTGGWNNL